MSDVALLYVTFPSRGDAETVAETVLAERLAACVNILAPCVSIYRWQGKVERGEEVPALFKTMPQLAGRLRARIEALHPYDLPVIETWPAAFERTATYPVFQNRPAGEDAASETVAEISATSEDGRTLVYTDAVARRIGFLDISDPDRPEGLGTLSLASLGDAEDEPTSVTVVGSHVLVVVNTSASYTEPSGRLDVISLRTRTRVASPRAA